MDEPKRHSLMSTWLGANIFLAEYSLANIRNILAVITCVKIGQPGERDKFNEDEKIHTIVKDLIIAAADTTSYSTLWTLYLLANHPDIQHRARQSSTK